METLLVALVALGLGFLLIALIGAARPKPSAEGPGVEEPHAWLARLDAQQLCRLLCMLVAELGFEVEDRRASGETVDVFAVNRAPISGGRLYIRGLARPLASGVGEQEALLALETARAAMAGKALVVTVGRFLPRAQALSKEAPLELVDGPALLELVRKHLPQVAATRTL